MSREYVSELGKLNKIGKLIEDISDIYFKIYNFYGSEEIDVHDSSAVGKSQSF